MPDVREQKPAEEMKKLIQEMVHKRKGYLKNGVSLDILVTEWLSHYPI